MSLPSIEALTTGNFFSASTAAFTKKDMKPSFTPCFFSKPSLYFARSVHHGLEVDLVERGELRLRVLRLEQALGDARAQARHRHALILSAGGAGGGAARAAAADLSAPAAWRPACRDIRRRHPW